MDKWNELPGDLLAKVDELITYIDKIRIRTVCVSWHCSLPKMPSSSGKMSQLPWLLQANSHNKTSSHEFFNPLDREQFYCSVSLEELMPLGSSLMPLGSSSNGWMVTMGYTSPAIYLVNPITLENIQLSPRSKFPDVKKFRANKANHEYDILDTVSTQVHRCDSGQVHSSYTTKIVWCPAAAGGQFTPAAIYGLHRNLAYCESGDKNWRCLPTSWVEAVNDIIFYQGQIYALSGGGNLKVFEFLNVSICINGRRVAAAAAAVPPHTEFMRLVESSCGDLLLVVGDPVADERGIISSRGCKFRIFKFEFQWGLSWSWGWSEVKNIGDEMIFFSSKSCISISSQNCQGNCIYFADDIFEFQEIEVESGGSQINLFSLENGGSVKAVKALARSPTFWFRPNFDQFTTIKKVSTDGMRNKIAALMSSEEVGFFSRQILVASFFHLACLCLSC